MSLTKYLQRLQFMDYLIRKRATGNLQTFAKKNRLSKSHLESVLKEMKEAGFPICYDKNIQSYYYKKEGQMVKSLFVEKATLLPRHKKPQIEMIDVHNICYSETAIFERCTEE